LPSKGVLRFGFGEALGKQAVLQRRLGVCKRKAVAPSGS